MSKNQQLLLAFGLMMLVNHFALIWLPWYWVMPINVLIAYILRLQPGRAALLGFLSIFLVWGAYSFLIDYTNNSILSSKIGELFGGIGSVTLCIITGFLGGIAGCLGGWCGGLLGEIMSV